MLIDAAVLPSGSTLDASVCVVGAGPAGLTIARELAARGVDCIVLERGGEPGEPLGVGASETVVTDDSDFEPPPGIPPRFGGGSNEWIVRLPWMRRGVRMLPLAPIDFETRDWDGGGAPGLKDSWSQSVDSLPTRPELWLFGVNSPFCVALTYAIVPSGLIAQAIK